MRLVLLGLLLWTLVGLGCAHQGTKARPPQAEKAVPQQAAQAAAPRQAAKAVPQPVEKLGVGDAVKVTVFQQPDLTLDARVDEKGTILMPLVGSIKVAGLTTNAAAAQIAQALKQGKYLNNPQVNVALTTVRSRQVSVLGMVAKPGRYPLDETSSQLADVIAAAGGILPTGSETVLVAREGKEQKVPLIGKGYLLKGGETVYVDRAPMFYIYGEVTRAGAYKVEPNMSVMQAIAAGGGMTPRGSDRRLKLRRATADGKWVETDVGLQEQVRADDVIYVREALF
ncbi:MAG TPA: polysaccharide export protein EpsE [Burkholderiales bacterium]|jgi:polysaccharide export outer membrane protein